MGNGGAQSAYLAELASAVDRSEGFPRTGYFVPGCVGTGAWWISGVVRVTAGADFVFF